jgi:hypothetical protein
MWWVGGIKHVKEMKDEKSNNVIHIISSPPVVVGL